MGVDGDVIRTKGINYDVDNTFVYTNSTITTKIENKGGIMLWGKWDIMWDFEYCGYFGIYGTPSKHLPVQVGDRKISWTLDSDGYPTKCVTTGATGGYSDWYNGTIYFEWE